MYRKYLFTILIFISSNAFADSDYSQINSIVGAIKSSSQNGVNCLPESTIRNAVESFYFGQKSGAISSDRIAASGGIYNAAVSSLRAQAIGAGIRCN